MVADREYAAILAEREAAEPEFFARLRSAPAFQALVGAGVPADALLEHIAWARAGRENRNLRVSTKRLDDAAFQLRAAAAALERVSGGPVAAIRPGTGEHGTFDPLGHAALMAAAAAMRALGRDGTEADAAGELSLLARLFNPASPGRPLRAALLELAASCGRVAERLRPGGPLKRTAQTIFLRMIPRMVEQYTGRPHHAEVAVLFTLVFDLKRAPDVHDFARLIRDARHVEPRRRK